MKIALTTFGSAGDLLPLVPVADCLRDRGHVTRWILPRGLALYVRGRQWGEAVFGDGSELRAATDPRVLTGRWSGWLSWRRLIDIYLIPRLPSDAAEIGAILRDWRPDCLVASGLSTAARLAAKESPVPIVEVTLTPQWCRLANGHARFASSLLSHLSGLTGSTKHCELVRLAWGVPPDVVLHERSLIDGSDADVTGYPYADDWWADDQSDRTEDWIASGSDPVIACTFGSFFGYSSSGIFSDVRSILDLLGLRGVIVGARSGDVRETGRLRVIGRMPHSRLFPLTPVVIHHGGLGTSVAAIRAGRPAVVAPRAFDQPYNARLLEARGVALDASSLGLRSAIETIIGDLAAFERNVHRIRSTFSVPAETVQRAASSIERKAAEAQI